jgi:tripartite-type tricarboxylate transporter receptor subunit TctC
MGFLFTPDDAPRASARAPKGAKTCAALAALVALVPLCAMAQDKAQSAAQDDVAAFYAGRAMSIVIGSAAGGGYDFYGRLVARHMGRHMPGRPTITPSNMPGAGGNVAVAHVYTLAAKDGSVMAASSSGSLLDALIGDASLVRYEPLKLNLIGSANSEVAVCVVRKDAQVQSFAEAFSKDKELVIGASGGTTRDLPMALINILGARIKLVSGYAGSRDVMLAMEKGEVQGLCGIGYQATMTQRPNWFKADSPMRALVQETLRGEPELDRQNVPKALDFAKTPEDRQALETVYAQLLFTRPFMMAPGVPPARVAAVRKAFMAALADPDLRAEAQKLNLAVDPMSGEELESRLKALYATPAPVLERVRKAIQTQ